MQLKEVVYAQDSQEITENSGPLEEIEFWRNRCVDLSSISTQLDKPEVKKIESILDAVKSSYVGQFRKYAQQIQVKQFILLILTTFISSSVHFFPIQVSHFSEVLRKADALIAIYFESRIEFFI